MCVAGGIVNVFMVGWWALAAYSFLNTHRNTSAPQQRAEMTSSLAPSLHFLIPVPINPPLTQPPQGLELRNNSAGHCCHTRWSSFSSLLCKLPSHLSGPHVQTVSHLHTLSWLQTVHWLEWMDHFLFLFNSVVLLLVCLSVDWSVGPQLLDWLSTCCTWTFMVPRGRSLLTSKTNKKINTMSVPNRHVYVDVTKRLSMLI